MADQLEICGPDGERSLTSVAAGSFVVGSAAAADVRLDWPGIDARHLRFVRTAAGVRIEPVRPGGTVAVNGEELFCKDLVAGDVVAVAGVRLRWLPGERAPEVRQQPLRSGTPASRPPAPRRGTGANERPLRRPARRRGPSTWLAVTLTVAVLGVAALLLIRHLGGSTWPNSPQHYVDLARAQFSNQQVQRALDTLAFALRDATGATREEALQLEATIRRLQLEMAEMPKVAVARQEQELLLEYAGRYLRDTGGRAEAREFVRSCDQWLARHGDACARVPDGQPLLRRIEELRGRWVALAALSEPDTPADVVFAARTRLRFQWRDYRGAVARLDAFLGVHPGEATVRAERETIVAEGASWLQGKLRNVDLLLERGDTGNAERDIGQLERWSVLPEWAPMVAERRQRLGPGR